MKFRNIFIALFLLLINIQSIFAEEARVNFSINIPDYLSIETPNIVLVANVTDHTGNLYTPLYGKFRVISNCKEKKTLYLKSTSITDNGSEESMFNIGNRVYIAFTNINKKPTSSALANCKMKSHSKESPGVVAYPVNSIIGAKSQYQYGQGKYKISIENGITDILVNIGSNVLNNSFDNNDPKGFYQATLSLTESDI